MFAGVVAYAVASSYGYEWQALGGLVAVAGAWWAAIRSERHYRLTRSRQVRVLVRPGCVVSDTRANKARHADEIFYVDKATAWSLERNGYVHVLHEEKETA